VGGVGDKSLSEHLSASHFNISELHDPSIPHTHTKKGGVGDSVDAFLVGKGFQWGRLYVQIWPWRCDQIKWNVRTRDLQKVELKNGAEAAYMDVLTKD